MITYLRIAKYALTALAGIATLVIARRALARLPMPACDESIRAANHGGTRPASQLRLIVLHSTEADSARSTANYFASPDSKGSTHFVIDDTECFRTLPDTIEPWGATGDRANADGLHVEMSGHYDWSRAKWLEHRATIEKAAAIAQHWGREYSIPMRFLKAADLKRLGASARGVTTHAEITKAFGVEGGHLDPGDGYPVDVFMRLAG